MLRYAAFAAFAMMVNIAAQMVTFANYEGPAALWLAIAIGTVTGLSAKYLLDRRWIFYDASSTLSDHSIKFSFYTLTGVPTTIIFWVTEWLFDWLGGSPAWRYAGAVTGLTIGYAIKYRLDRRFVFSGAFE